MKIIFKGLVNILRAFKNIPFKFRILKLIKIKPAYFT